MLGILLRDTSNLPHQRSQIMSPTRVFTTPLSPRCSFALCGALLLLALLLSPPAQAVQLSGQFTQGGLVIGRALPGSRVEYAGRALTLSADGHFVFGFGRDADLQQQLVLVAPDGSRQVESFRIEPRHYQTQRINGISARMMNPSAEEQRQIERDMKHVAAARQVESEQEFFLEPFDWPVQGDISGVYGSRRILNGEPRQPHFGVDIAAPAGTPVVAPAGGRVTLAEPGMFYSGKTLILDHGHGLSSSFLHLSEILVGVGDQVRKGETIARVGASGRVTGPHLDWRVNWFEVRLDPQLLVRTPPETGVER